MLSPSSSMGRLLATGLLASLVCVIGSPIYAYSFGKDLPPEQEQEPPVPTTCSPPRFTGQSQFLSSPKGTAKYLFDGICTSPQKPGAQLQYRLEASWSPSETDPRKPNASESITMTGYEPFIPIRAPGGRIFMFWTGRCKQDPWLQPEGASCRIVGISIPEDLRVVVPELQTLNFPKTENMIAPADRQRLHAQYLRVNSPVAGTKRIPGVMGQTDDMFTITNPIRNAVVQQGQLFLKADPPKSGATQVTELEFKWLDAPANQPYAPNVFAVDTLKLLQGYQVDQAVTRGNAGRWEVRARTSGKAVPGPWSFPVQFKLFITQPTQSQKQTSPVQQTAPLPSSGVTPASPLQQTAPLPPSSVIQATPPSSATQMRRSPFMVTPRGIDEKGETEGNQTVDEPVKTEKKP